MNLIMNKSRNSLSAENTDKLMYIYLNKQGLDCPKEWKDFLRYAGLDMIDLCEMKDQLL